ncbi:hypothetical protein HRR83_009549 [Exophiala dermatitidis]|uniref:Pre-rRNA processing protein n=1 Tax=Exophiala dermatitidis TaxID=5970 RepID=A0AAN6EV37_EXODE|nr:hypothetical protein HRR75_006973 [Exophiala dermatitidis]KAJ4509012.1 hypothetical protein HRR74_007604 [Exophiala dermatitidis]KAJ4510264.1 hypothetical protein HRR73_007062 [Exophiala dermatitidis]KAJ4539277.1 hypothetical protein HRR77_006684 [Exophiala dermatitidis]KAJ4540442.1 hypothetical protein HRR76_003839 [Exophiala dermatitidis]
MSSRQTSPRSSERTPLLSRPEDDSAASYTGQPDDAASGAGSGQSDLGSEEGKKRKRWPTVVALSILCLAVVVACFGFALPSAVEEYAKEGVVFNPTNISIDSFTSLGIRARVQGDFYLDASRVRHKPTRDLGRFGTWIAREVESGESLVRVYLPDYDNVLVGTLTMPPLKLNIRNRHYNHVDILADLEPGDVDGIRRVAKDFMDGKLKEITARAVATVPVRSGLLRLGDQMVAQILKFEGRDVPSVPDIDLREVRFAEYGMPGHPEGVKAMAVVSILNDFPLKFDVPSLKFEVLLPDCQNEYLRVATARTDDIHILPQKNITASITALVSQLPTSLTEVCPNLKISPLDSFIGDYLAGRETTVYIRGGEQDENTPEWIGKILRETTMPFSVPGHTFDNLIKNFTLADVHFSLPDPVSQSSPKLSAVVKVLVGLPPDMNINLDVNKVRADSEVFYKGDLLGSLDLSKWQKANATKIENDLLVQSIVKDAPLKIKNDSVFAGVVHDLVFGKGASLTVHASVDVDTLTALGEFVVRKIPAQGNIFINPLSGGDFQMPEISGMEVVNTSKSALTLQARVNVTNPTDYSVSIPYCNVSLWVNNTRVGYAWLSANVVPGPNEIIANAAWEVGKVGGEWLSQYISGHNTTLTVTSHADTIPGFPDPKMNMTVPTPRMFGHFLKETTMHILSSTATFVLVSPFAMYINSIAANAYHNGSVIGTIDWDYPFAIVAGENLTPRLPVDWNSNALGTIREALGGSLKVDARADVGVRIGEWQEQIWYEGHGLRAKIRL